MIRIVIDGKPQGKQRPRVTRRGTYTPEETKKYEAHVQYLFAKAYQEHEPLTGALKMDIVAYFPIPASASKKQKQLMRENIIRPTVKPDLDNIYKIVADSLNSCAYGDDKQLVEGSILKYYADIPRVEVTIEEI